VLYVGQLTYVELSEVPTPKKSRILTKLDFAEPLDSEVDMSLERLQRQLVGKLTWVSSRTRWDMRAASGAIARWSSKPCQRLVNAAATLLHLIVEQPRELRFSPVEGIAEMRLWVDASYDDAKGTCVCGWIAQLVAADAPAETRDNIFAWHSHKETRIVRSTASAELLAMVAGLTRASAYLEPARLCFDEVRFTVLTDSQALIDQLRKGRTDAEPRLTGRLKFCLQELEALDGHFYFVQTDKQQADCLTKYIPTAVSWPIDGQAAAGLLHAARGARLVREDGEERWALS
jgi:ribonuclease HI